MHELSISNLGPLSPWPDSLLSLSLRTPSSKFSFEAILGSLPLLQGLKADILVSGVDVGPLCLSHHFLNSLSIGPYKL